MTERYLEDYTVGQTFAQGGSAFDAGQIKSFAAEFDPQPFYLDEQTASRTIFRGLAGERLAYSGPHDAASGRC